MDALGVVQCGWKEYMEREEGRNPGFITPIEWGKVKQLLEIERKCSTIRRSIGKFNIIDNARVCGSLAV